jgi:hydrogenase expression/formation protein HypC
MCLAIPGKVIEIDGTAIPRMGKASFGGIQKKICLEWVPDVKIGEYVIVHVGFAISKMNEEEAMKTLSLMEQMEGAFEDLNPVDPDQHKMFPPAAEGNPHAIS